MSDTTSNLPSTVAVLAIAALLVGCDTTSDRDGDVCTWIPGGHRVMVVQRSVVDDYVIRFSNGQTLNVNEFELDCTDE